MKTIVIAEAGVNHNGDMQIARKLIEAAALAGADLVKFQSFNTKEIVASTAPKAEYQKLNSRSDESQFDMLLKLEISRSDHFFLKLECEKHGIGFLSTAFDRLSFDILCEMGDQQFVKIPSGEITNLPLIRYTTRLGLPVLLSTGMATLGEIESAIYHIEASGTPRHLITLLHCTSEYPAPLCHVNLKAMVNMQHAFGLKVGYSDHTLGIEVPIAATALGATVIEKHFTLDRNLPGPDHSASLEPNELRTMITKIRNIEQALGDGLKRPSETELRNSKVSRKSIVALRGITSGERFSEENIGTKRPGFGISPMLWDDIIGRSAKRDFIKGELIEL